MRSWATLAMIARSDWLASTSIGLAFGRLSPHAGKPKQICDEPFDMVPDHEIGEGGDRRFVCARRRAVRT